jgi:hypothetical protein
VNWKANQIATKRVEVISKITSPTNDIKQKINCPKNAVINQRLFKHFADFHKRQIPFAHVVRNTDILHKKNLFVLHDLACNGFRFVPHACVCACFF